MGKVSLCCRLGLFLATSRLEARDRGVASRAYARPAPVLCLPVVDSAAWLLIAKVYL